MWRSTCTCRPRADTTGGRLRIGAMHVDSSSVASDASMPAWRSWECIERFRQLLTPLNLVKLGPVVVCPTRPS